MNILPAVVDMLAQLPKPPTPEQFQSFGFAGIIFGSFFFLVCVSLWLSWKYLTTRDQEFALQQEKRDLMLQKALSDLSTSHEKTVERMTSSAERVADGASAATRDISVAVKELTKEVQTSHRVFSEEVLSATIRRAFREIRAEEK